MGSAIQFRKSSAHAQHGYRLEKSPRKERIWVCFSGVAEVGYVAVRVCRKVQVERPSSSTSGGQSVWVNGVDGGGIVDVD